MIIDLNKQQMQKLELKEDENPVIYMFPGVAYLKDLYSIYGQTYDAINSSNLSEAEKKEFNE